MVSAPAAPGTDVAGASAGVLRLLRPKLRTQQRRLRQTLSSTVRKSPAASGLVRQMRRTATGMKTSTVPISGIANHQAA